MSPSPFMVILRHIESELAACYGFVVGLSAIDCLTQSPQALAIAQAGHNRATTLVYQDSTNSELQLGLYFQEDLIEILVKNSPAEKLSISNLDAFCVAVEELSHFHLLAHRAQLNQSVSRLELEWQGEMDKWLLAGRFLEKQTGDPHFPQLSRLIFDESISIGLDQDRYDEAHRIAAGYCYKLLPKLQNRPSKERTAMLGEACRSTYDLHWAAKLRIIRTG